ncbi:MAG: cell division topological specificity factor MinE [Lachnospiraceae bacterium]
MNLLSVIRKKNSGEIARNRLKTILVADQIHCSPETIDLMKDDMIRVLSKYMVVDRRGIQISLIQRRADDHGKTTPALYADIPILDIRGKGNY